MRAPVRRGKGSFAAADHSLYWVSRSRITRGASSTTTVIDGRGQRLPHSLHTAHSIMLIFPWLDLAQQLPAAPNRPRWRQCPWVTASAAARDGLGCCRDENAVEKRLEELHGCDADSEAAQHSPDNGACNHRPGDPSIASRERKAEGRVITFVRIPTHTRMHPPIRARKRQNLVALEVCPDAVAIDREGIVGPAAQ